MSRAKKALAALAALAASASAAHPPAAANCSRHIRVGVFDDANPLAASFLTGWMDNAATACYSFHHMSTGNRAIELLANGDLEFAIVGSMALRRSHRESADTQWYKLDEGQELQATLAHAFRCSVPRIVSRVDALLRGSEEPAPRGVLPGVGREPGCVTLPDIYMCN